MDRQRSDRVFLRTRRSRRTLSLTARPHDEVLAATIQIREPAATLSSVRANTTRSLIGRRGQGSRQSRPLNAPAPTPSPVVAQFAGVRAAKARSSPSLPLWTTHLPSQTTKLSAPQ